MIAELWDTRMNPEILQNNLRKSPIQDEYIEKYLAEKPLDLTATLDGRRAYADADFVVIAAPTNYAPCLGDVHRMVGTRDIFFRD